MITYICMMYFLYNIVNLVTFLSVELFNNKFRCTLNVVQYKKLLLNARQWFWPDFDRLSLFCISLSHRFLLWQKLSNRAYWVSRHLSLYVYSSCCIRFISTLNLDWILITCKNVINKVLYFSSKIMWPSRFLIFLFSL